MCVCFFKFIQLLTNKINVEQHVIFEINSSLSHSRCALIICKPSPLFEDFHVFQAFAVSLHSAHYGFRRFRKIISICLEYITNVYQQYSMQYLMVFSIFIEFFFREFAAKTGENSVDLLVFCIISISLILVVSRLLSWLNIILSRSFGRMDLAICLHLHLHLCFLLTI